MWYLAAPSGRNAHSSQTTGQLCICNGARLKNSVYVWAVNSHLSIHQWSVLSHPAACRRSVEEAARKRAHPLNCTQHTHDTWPLRSRASPIVLVIYRIFKFANNQFCWCCCHYFSNCAHALLVKKKKKNYDEVTNKWLCKVQRQWTTRTIKSLIVRNCGCFSIKIF